MVVLSDREYNELIASAAMEGYDTGYRHGRRDAIDEIWESMRTKKTDSAKDAPVFLSKKFHI